MEIKAHIPMSRSTKYQKRNHTRFMCSKALGLGEMSKRCVYLQLHDLCTGDCCSWFAEHTANTLPRLTLITAVVAQPVQWLLKAGLLVEHSSTNIFQLLLLEVSASWTETSVDYRCIFFTVTFLSINEHQSLHSGHCCLSKLELNNCKFKSKLLSSVILKTFVSSPRRTVCFITSK